MSLQSFTFSAQPQGERGFGAYHDLYASGSDVARIDEAFHARVRAFRFARMIVFDRHMHGLQHSRDPARVRRDGFDHATLHLLVSGSLSGGAPGQERHVAPGEILVFDTTLPQWSQATHAHVITVAVARDQVEPLVPALRGFHGTVLPERAGGLLGDLMASLARRADSLSPQAASRAARAMAEFLAAALGGGGEPREDAASIEQLVILRRDRAEAFIEANLGDSDLDAERIAMGTGMSRSVLYRLFAADGGVANYIRVRRLDRMRIILRRKGEVRSISTLAYACGFTSESHCSRAFRTAFGLPPGQFRADMQHARKEAPAGSGSKPPLAAWLCELY